MNKLTAIAVALTLLGCSAALAQPNENRSREGRLVAGQQQIEAQNRNARQDRNQAGDRNNARDENRNDDRGQRANDVRDNPHWSRGDRLPRDYRDNQYVVSDWKTSHLRRPPRGYHWVRADNRYVLAAITTGVIADIIINSQR